MAISLKHAFTSGKADSGDATLVQPSNWNAEHTMTAATDTLIGRQTAGTGAVEEIACTAAGRALLDDADAATQRATLGVGAVVLGYSTLSNVNSVGFSGSWSDYCVLNFRMVYRIETGTSATASAGIYSDGGTTAFLSLATASTTQSAGQVIAVEYDIYGTNGRGSKLMSVRTNKATNLQTFAATGTANTSFVNAVKYFSSATITAGMAVLIGYRTA